MVAATSEIVATRRQTRASAQRRAARGCGGRASPARSFGWLLNPTTTSEKLIRVEVRKITS